MKTWRIPFALLLVIGLYGCKPDLRDEVVPVLTETSAPGLVLAPQALMFDSISRMALVRVESDSIFTFSQPTTQIATAQVGTILMVGPTPQTPFGLLRRVTAVTRQGEMFILHTSQAALTDAIERGRIQLDRQLSVRDIYTEELAEGVTRVADSSGRIAANGFYYELEGVEFTFDDGSELVISGELTMNPDVYFDADIDFFALQQLDMRLAMNHTAELNATYGGQISFPKREIPIGKYVLGPLMAGPVPFFLEVELELEVEGSIQGGINLGLSYDVTGGFEAHYADGNATATFIRETRDSDWSFRPTAALEMKLGLDPEVGLSIYKVLSVEAEGLEFVALVSADPFSNPCWELQGGIQLDDLELEGEILGFDVNIGEWSFQPYLWDIAEGPCFNPGIVSGLVRSSPDGRSLEGVAVVIFDGGDIVASGTTDQAGRFEFEVPAGENYEARFSRTGYLTDMYPGIAIEPSRTTYLEQVLSLDASYAGPGNISGVVRNAINAQGIVGVVLALRRGINTRTGPVVASATTSVGGTYVFDNIDAGNYTIEATAPGYITGFFPAHCIGGRTNTNQNGNLSPDLPAGQVRIVLRWGATPYDLDSHLTGPATNGDRFHVYWWDQTPWYANANLDVDDVSSYGPETITITEQQPGLYRYSIHDYSNRSKTYSTALAYSQASVEVYIGELQIATLHVPNRPGTLWTVFEMEGSNFTPVNTMSYESASGNVRSETDGILIQRMPAKDPR